MAETLVRITDLSKIFRRDNEDVIALDRCSLEIARGEFLALMGPSGSGKTTLLNLIAGIDRPSTGEVEVDGVNIEAMSDRQLAGWRNRHIGFVFQSFNLIPVLTAFENVELPLLLTHLTKTERRSHVETALRLVGLEDRMRHFPRQLSGGQEQRVAIARAIVPKPAIVLADEPTANVDSVNADSLLTLMEGLNHEQGVTFLFSTHDQRVMDRAHRIIRLRDGRLVSDESQP